MVVVVVGVVLEAEAEEEAFESRLFRRMMTAALSSFLSILKIVEVVVVVLCQMCASFAMVEVLWMEKARLFGKEDGNVGKY